ncbi:MAG: right-handed parallel beta-helix repeat-containing protein [Planctomycetes bacterium]|nr:right-handed parallel beta-helix repeat-containing protein [Planctomycetota bacterium]
MTMHHLPSVLSAGMLWAFAALPAQAASTFTVSLTGSDTNPGTASQPFATLERARDAVRALPRPLSNGGAVIEVRTGTYQLTRPLELGADDSGTPDARVVWRASKGDAVRLVGGRMVGGWQPVADHRVLQRLDPAARGNVWQVDLRAQGITQYGEMKSAPSWGSSEAGLEVFFRDTPMTLARWPNEGYATIQSTPDLNYDVRGTRGTTSGRFTFEGDRPARWVDEPDVMLHGWWFWDWADQRLRVSAIDLQTKEIALDNRGAALRQGQWYYAYNLLCELDQPGEWYLDREAGILYLWPPEPVRDGQVMISLIPSIVTMKEVSHVTLQGLTMEGCQGTAISTAGGEGNRVVGCVVRNVGGFAVRVEGGKGHGVIGCDMYQMGNGGIILHGGDRRTLAHAEHFAENNHIHHFSRWNPMYKVGIELYGVGCRASHNLIHHAPHVAISFCGQEHLLEYNEIHNVVEHANDAGAIYTQPGIDEDWTMRGHVVRYNYIHHIYGFQGRGCCGVYLDDLFSSMHCHGNVFYQVPAAAFIGGGRDNVVENNLFIECNPAIHVDARGLGWCAGIEPMLRERLREIPYQQPPWSTRYPQLLTVLDDEPMAPKGNVFRRNISWGGRWDDIEAKARPFVRFEENLIDEDPHLMDPTRLDFRLRPDSPAWKIGFEPIPWEKIGLYHDDARASWPVVHPADPAPAGTH